MTDQNQSSTEPVIPDVTECHDQMPQKSGFAIASLVLGIIGFLSFGITAAFGLIFGIIALVQIGKDKSPLIGQKVAVAGVVVSSIALIIGPMLAILGAVMFPAFMKARLAAQATTCMSNVKQISMGVMMYSNEHNDTLPDAAKWVESISLYLPDKKLFHCPSVESDWICYAMNNNLDKVSIGKINNPPDTVMIFESIREVDNPNGGIGLLPLPGRHDGTNNIGFADGHVMSVRDEDITSVIWDLAQK